MILPALKRRAAAYSQLVNNHALSRVKLLNALAIRYSKNTIMPPNKKSSFSILIALISITSMNSNKLYNTYVAVVILISL